MHKAGLHSLAILIKMKIIINLWLLQHERSTFNTNYPEYLALLVWGGVGIFLVLIEGLGVVDLEAGEGWKGSEKE